MGKIDEMVTERKLLNTRANCERNPDLLKKLGSLRLKHHKHLLESGIVERVAALGLIDTVDSADDFYIVRRSLALKVTDDELKNNPGLAYQLDVFISIIGESTKILQIQRLKPVIDLDQYDKRANIASLGVIACGLSDSKALKRLDIDGMEARDMSLLEDFMHELESAAANGVVPLDKESLIAIPPLAFVKPGIPLV